ncbi:MAG: ABC transporter permease [Candidatus Zixiibacteriota bacterium]|nr:MAG: ABC transporter permease [candidate division Zixibacteria bacterium]
MLKNYLKVALRNLIRHKGYSFINVFGLAVSLASCVIIAMWVQKELSFDRFHEHQQNIYRIIKGIRAQEGAEADYFARAPFPVAEALRSQFPEILTVRFFQLWNQTPLISYEENRFYEDRFFFVDSTVFAVFSFGLQEGDPATALTRPYSVVLTQATASKYFGNEDPIGKTITLEEKLDYTVTGVLEEIPANSHIHFDFLAAMADMETVFSTVGTPTAWLQSWYWTACPTYVLLPDNVSAISVNNQLPGFVDRFFPERFRGKTCLSLQALADIHLYSHLGAEIEKNGDVFYVYVFSAAGLLILFIACVNFVNLSVAKAMSRAKEVGLRWVCGGHRGQLINQFLLESSVMSSTAMVIAVVLLELCLPVLNRHLLTGLSPAILGNWYFCLGFVFAVFVIGLMAGSYPAFVLSGFRPGTVLRRTTTCGSRQRSRLRRVLIVLQFTVSIVLGVSALTIHSQLDFMQNKELGFTTEHIIGMLLAGTDLRQDVGHRGDAFRNRLLQHADVSHVTFTSVTPGVKRNVVPFDRGQGSNERIDLPTIFVDYDFLETFGLDVTEGRPFSKDRPADSGSSFILNEIAVRTLGWDEAVGKPLRFYGADSAGQVIGVVEDFNYESLHKPVGPLVLALNAGWYDQVFVRMQPPGVRSAVQHVMAAWAEFVPSRPLEFTYLDDELSAQYRFEESVDDVMVLFTGLAIFIACLGLLGLAAFSAEQRTKEIGIRKVLGSSVTGIVRLLTGEFVVLVAIANVIAWPVTYYVMNLWLQDFAYRIELGIGTFVLAGLAAMLIALLTVSYQAIRAARANPVEALKYE